MSPDMWLAVDTLPAMVALVVARVWALAFVSLHVGDSTAASALE